MPNNLQDIRDKYLHDVSYIKDHVQYLEDYFLAVLRLMGNINEVSPTFSATQTINNLCQNNRVIQNEFSEYLHYLNSEMLSLNVVEKQPNDPSGEDPSVEGDVICFLCGSIYKGQNDPEKLFREAQLQVEVISMMKGDLVGFEDYLFLNEHPERIRQLVHIALEESTRRHYESLSAEKGHIHMTAKSLELFDAMNQINMYRQNFIQVMAYFDSCIFDMVRLCMRQNFFEWLLSFDNVNVKTHELASYNDFDTFREAHIESALKKCYVKDLLKIIHCKFNGVFTIDGNDIYPIVQEMLGRRNVHIHHNGIADQMYIENFNIFGASQGDYLRITKEYFDRAMEITKQIITAIEITCN